MNAANSLARLLPVHSAVVEALAEDFGGEQHAPRPTTPLPNIPLGSLQGNPQLVLIAQNDHVLARKLKWLLDSCNEANWEEALAALDHIAFSLRTNQLEARADEAGVVKG